MNDIGLLADISALYKSFLDKVLENHQDVFWKIIRTAGRGHTGGLCGVVILKIVGSLKRCHRKFFQAASPGITYGDY